MESPTTQDALIDDNACTVMQAEAQRLQAAALFDWALKKAYREWLLTEKDTVN